MKYLISSFVLASSLILPQLALAEVEVVVHPSNSAALDKDAIKRIFLGKTRAFPGGGEAVPIALSRLGREPGIYQERTIQNP